MSEKSFAAMGAAAGRSLVESYMRAATPHPVDAERRWPIETDDQVEALAHECGWRNRRYMTTGDYAIWCEQMRTFARLSAIAPAGTVAQEPVAIPDGWQLVPKEPTIEMLKAADLTVLTDEEIHHGPFELSKAEWTAMLAASPQPAAVQEPVAVKALDWRPGYRDFQVKIQQASTGPHYQVRELDGVVWLDADNVQTIYPSVEDAKAAAQADYERRIKSALVASPPSEPAPQVVDAAQAVCWFDWSNNDSDAVAAIDRLRAALASQEKKG